ncbi:hypothetical protein [Gordonia sihwensis]|uniref:hypothetical protein n=1 Tax=Gordonia sihwensis TaxID=173559 RepID=UPI0012E00C54|nr:hypothetical protein [Gordonia sihwensis]
MIAEDFSERLRVDVDDRAELIIMPTDRGNARVLEEVHGAEQLQVRPDGLIRRMRKV